MDANAINAVHKVAVPLMAHDPMTDLIHRFELIGHLDKLLIERLFDQHQFDRRLGEPAVGHSAEFGVCPANRRHGRAFARQQRLVRQPRQFVGVTER